MVNDNRMLKMAFSQVFTSVDKTSAKIRKIDKDFVKELDFQNMMFSCQNQRYPQIREKNGMVISVFGYKNENKYPVYISKIILRDVDLLFKENEGKTLYVLIKDFNRFMYHQALPQNRKHFCCYCLQNFSSAEILKNVIMTVLKLMANK